MVKARRTVLLVITMLIIAGFSCGRQTEKAAPSITINLPSPNSILELGEVIEIVSTASGEAGISRVELSIDGRVVNVATPPQGNPTTFAAIQPWKPEGEGEVRITVVAHDTNGIASEPATIEAVVLETKVEITVTPTTTPTMTPTAEAPTEVPCTLDANFIKNVTIPDNNEISPGEMFTKIWRVSNSGTCDWQPGTELIFSGGDSLDGPSSVLVPTADAGSMVDIRVDLTAPAAYGGYTGIWRLRAEDGTVFGPHLTVTIIVPEPDEDTPTLTPTPTGTPTRTPMPKAQIQRVDNLIPLAPGESGHAVVVCPDKSVVTSGGFSVQPDVFVYTQSKSGNGWQAYGVNNGASEKILKVYAACISNTNGTSSQILAQVAAPAGGIGHGIATCPAGSVVTGGGWATNSDGSLVIYNSSKSGNAWQIYAQNTSGEDKFLNAYAICLAGTHGATEQVGNSVSITAGSTGAVQATCGNETMATGGGYATNKNMYVYDTSLEKGSDTTWWSYAINRTGSNQLLGSYAICISFP